ncbi:MAG TPA: biopolymer transporter ExbD [Bacteroidetes bacterium]|nr:biopolymer transporter ExbD [Bacteroidota bacterium]
MAEVDTGGGGGGKHKGGPKQKKKSTKIDMTAMVDVAFLLLTFFILTTTLATPQAMELNKPPKTDDPIDNQKPVKESKVLTLILGEEDKIHYYVGITEPVVKSTDFSAEGFRKIIVDHLNKFPNRCTENGNAPGCWDPIIVIKPNKSCRYKNMVDALDEMRISKVPKYALDEVSSADSLLLADNNLK